MNGRDHAIDLLAVLTTRTDNGFPVEIGRDAAGAILDAILALVTPHPQAAEPSPVITLTGDATEIEKLIGDNYAKDRH